MAEDFSKIFAQGATSKQSWTDSNYNTGWGYLGQEPPPYELFDYLFNRLDKKDKELYDVFNGFNHSWLDYVPVKKVSDSTFRVTKGNLETEDIVINNVAHALSASTAVTADLKDKSTKIANTDFVQQIKSSLVGSAPSSLNTLEALSKSINNDPNLYETLISMLAPLASPSFTGTVTGPTPPSSANNTQFATTAWVLQSIAANATGPIIGDVSDSYGWWVKIPCKGFNLLIQGGEAGSNDTRGTIRFPVAAKLLNIVCTDVFYGDLNSMVDVRAVTLLPKTITPEKIDWITTYTGLGSFSWRGFFVQ